ncbi:unnamed protein product [Arctia plantaginis]|uniref:Uncharacterized protein n=1 Tax=Arctia plantaginis TaxID=874455 RepID=A0A8S0YUQ4_ARCPL|nr:unnamed protein product [Arctia plantaginis]
MFELKHYRYGLVVTVIVNVILEKNFHIYAINIPRRDGVDVFNLLLGLYKLNPLKHSKVYSKFAKNVLAPGDITGVLSSSENKNYQKKYQELKEIENVIHPLIKKQPKHSLDKPKYDVENVDTEDFRVDLVLPDNIETDYKPANKYGGINILEEYGIIKSNDNKMPMNNAPNTKFLPVNQWLLPTSIKHNPTSMGQLDRENRPHDNKNQYRQIPNSFQEAPIISDNELTADVVVL